MAKKQTKKTTTTEKRPAKKATRRTATTTSKKKATAAKTTTKKKTTRKAAPKKAAASKAPSKSADTKRYTKPALREKLKKRITAGDKGGAAGQWSARKAQMLAAAYKQQGGDYAAPKAKTQKHLDTWTDEKWSTSDGRKARDGNKTTRYLPKAAWEKLSPAEKRKTEVKKEAASKHGKQYVANTPKAKSARKKAVRKTPRKKARSKA